MTEGSSIKYLSPLEPSHEVLSRKGSGFLNEDERLRFVQNVVQLLFTTEFVILLEYTVVVAPIIYSTMPAL